MMLFHKEKNPSRAILKKLDGTHIRYVAERLPDATERILGRNGAVSVTDERVLLLCEGKAVFVCPFKQTSCAVLLSGDGAVFEGVDGETGERKTVTAYFTSPIRR